MHHLVIFRPGDGYQYPILITNLSGMDPAIRDQAGFSSCDPLYQATLLEWGPGKTTMIFSGYIAPGYAYEKIPSLRNDDRTRERFVGVCNTILENPDLLSEPVVILTKLAEDPLRPNL